MAGLLKGHMKPSVGDTLIDQLPLTITKHTGSFIKKQTKSKPVVDNEETGIQKYLSRCRKWCRNTSDEYSDDSKKH